MTESEAAARVARIRSEMIVLAGAMARCQSMPEPEAWPWPKRMPMKLRRAAMLSARDAEEQCRLWATRLRDLADSLMAVNVDALPKEEPIDWERLRRRHRT